MEVIGYILALFIGVSLGLMGGGGSILTVPLLVYFFHVETLIASTYSLVIVGVSSLLGVYSYWKEKNIDFEALINFGLPSIISVFLTKSFVVPLIPETIQIFNVINLKQETLLLLFFAFILLLASYSMIKKNNSNISYSSRGRIKLLMQGTLTGFITGIVGVGGGFLIIPVLVQVSKIPMKKAIGTSLFIIVLNAAVGLLANTNYKEFDFFLITKIIVLSLVGMWVGVLFSKKIDGEKLKKGFGWFVLIMGVVIFLLELIKTLN